MNLKQPDRPRQFLELFNHCYDGVVRRIQFRFTPGEAFGEAHLTVSVQRPVSRRSKYSWVNVRLTIREVEEFSVRESPKESCRVLSSGLHIEAFNGLLFFDFAPYSLNPRGVEDYRLSGLYIAGRSFSWKVQEYSKNAHARTSKR